jgi:hypothetical protein
MKEHSSSGAMNATGKVTAPNTPFHIQMRRRLHITKSIASLNDRPKLELFIFSGSKELAVLSVLG